MLDELCRLNDETMPAVNTGQSHNMNTKKHCYSMEAFVPSDQSVRAVPVSGLNNEFP